MMISNDGLYAQGEVLPAAVRHGTIQPVTALSKRQRGWRIKHPQAMTTQRDNLNLYPHHWRLVGDLSVFGGMGREPKKTPPLCLSFVWHCFAATRSAFVPHTQRIIPMIYTFLIATNRGRIADFQRIRTISAFAKSETEARQRLAGLPLIFVSRSPAQEVAA